VDRIRADIQAAMAVLRQADMVARTEVHMVADMAGEDMAADGARLQPGLPWERPSALPRHRLSMFARRWFTHRARSSMRHGRITTTRIITARGPITPVGWLTIVLTEDQ
jgi:hypothetical protein